MANENDGNIKSNHEDNAQKNVNNESFRNERNSERGEKYSYVPPELIEFSSGIGNRFSNTKILPNESLQINEYKQTNTQTQKREENPFSFKHFLNRDSSSSNPSTKSVTTFSSSTGNCSLTSAINTSYQLLNVKNNSSSVGKTSPSNAKHVSSSSICLSNSQENNNESENNLYNLSGENELGSLLQSKACVTESNTSNFSLLMGNSYQSSTGARPKVPQSISTSSSIGSGTNENSKMKRSPRFSSFDSQASLAECTGLNHENNDSILYNSVTRDINRDGCTVLDETCKKVNSFFNNNLEKKKFIPRSYSNYDIEITPSINNRMENCETIGRMNEPNISPVRNKNSPAVRPNRLIGISSQSSSNSVKNQNYCTKTLNGIRQNSEFAAAALPDFVQDHWMDQWYYNEMHLNSPRNSPNQSPIDFVEDLPSCVATGDKCQTLPDFLSDGPIIHSSGRLADVAAGLPDLDSPEDNSPALQLSRLKLENDRLRRELDESRITLSDQTRKINELERQALQSQNNELHKIKNLNEHIEQLDENLGENKKRSTAAEIQITKLKLQIKQLASEVHILRKENELLNERGAIGGDLTKNINPSKNKQLSKELIRAANNAENNLRQLLCGVDNLRLMARTLASENNVDNSDDGVELNRQSPSLITGTTTNVSNSGSTNLVNEEYLSDCDDFDDLSGPAL